MSHNVENMALSLGAVHRLEGGQFTGKRQESEDLIEALGLGPMLRRPGAHQFVSKVRASRP